MRSAGARTIDHATSADEAARLWKLRKSVSAAVAKVQIGKVNEDVVVPRDRVAELVARSRQIGLENELGVVNFGHLGDGNIHTTFLIDPRVPGDRLKRRRRCRAALRDGARDGWLAERRARRRHGQARLRRAPAGRRAGGSDAAHQAAFDPAGILNPGKKIPAAAAAPAAGEPGPGAGGCRRPLSAPVYSWAASSAPTKSVWPTRAARSWPDSSMSRAAS